MPLPKRLGWSHFWAGFVVIATVVSFVAGVRSLLPGPSPDQQADVIKSLREKAVDCRRVAYERLESRDRPGASESLNCAEKNFQQAVELGDSLAVWGLSLLYGDKVLRSLQNWDHDEYSRRAIHLWCKARRLGVGAAAGNAPFASKTEC